MLRLGVICGRVIGKIEARNDNKKNAADSMISALNRDKPAAPRVTHIMLETPPLLGVTGGAGRGCRPDALESDDPACWQTTHREEAQSLPSPLAEREGKSKRDENK